MTYYIIFHYGVNDLKLLPKERSPRPRSPKIGLRFGGKYFSFCSLIFLMNFDYFFESFLIIPQLDIKVYSITIHDSYQNNDNSHEKTINFDQKF